MAETPLKTNRGRPKGATSRTDNTDTDPDAAFATDRALARRYGVHRTTIWSMVNRGDLPAPVPLSKNIKRWPWADILAFEKKRRVETYGEDAVMSDDQRAGA
jgi:predicted DNA-binding transcriptional regulator AlpA